MQSRTFGRTARLVVLAAASVVAIRCTPKTEESGGPEAPAERSAEPAAPGTSVELAPLVGGRRSNAAPEIAAPLAPGSDEISAYLTVPNLDAAIKGVAAIASAVMPDPAMAPGEAQLKAQLGLLLGDPELRNLDTSRPIVVALLAADPLRAVGLIPARQAAPYDQALTQLGFQPRYADGLLEVGLTGDGLGAASTVRGLYDRIASAKVEATARLYVGVDSLLETFGAQITESLGQLTGFMAGAPNAGPDVGTILKAEVLGLLGLLEECDALQLELDAGAAGITAETVITAKAGSALAKLCSSSQALEAPSATLVEGSGPFVMSWAFDTASAVELVDNVLAKIARDPQCGELISPEVRQAFTSAGDWLGRGGVSVARIEGGSLAVDHELGIETADGLLAAMASFAELMAPGSAMHKLYERMGVQTSLTLDRDARTHSGVSIHRWKMDVEVDETGPQDPASAAMMQGMMRQELGVVTLGNVALMSSDADRLDRMIDSARAGGQRGPLSTRAMRIFGGGRQIYLDYDIVGILKPMLASLPAAQPGAAEVKRFTEMLSATDPVAIAGTFAAERAQFQVQVPVSLLRQLVTVGIQLQEMRMAPPPARPADGGAEAR